MYVLKFKIVEFSQYWNFYEK